MSDDEEPKKSLGDLIRGAVVSAAEDPEKFIEDAIGTVRKASTAVDAAVEKLKANPEVTKRVAVNAFLSSAAKAVRREFRF